MADTANAGDLALRNLERMIAKEPLLRDILNPTLPTPRRGGPHRPAIDVLETEEGWTVLVAVPGASPESLDVQLDGTRLVVSGETPSFHEAGAKVKARERTHGRFQREFLLPAGIDGDRIAANLKHGLLTVRIPRLAGGRKSVAIQED